MIVKVDAVKLAHELAIARVQEHSYMTIYNITPKTIRSYIENGSEGETNKTWEFLRNLYQEHHDFYFEMLTNSQV